MSEFEIQNIKGWPDTAMRSRAPEAPQKAIVLELNLTLVGGVVDFHYSNIGQLDLSANGGLHTQISHVRKKTLTPKNWRKPEETITGKNQLSIKCGELSYIIILLSDDVKNWQIGNNRPPITMSESVPLDQEGYPIHYNDPVRLDDEGNIVPDNLSEEDAIGLACRAAYFVADGGTLISEFGEKFRHSFNIHVDFVLENNGKKTLLPVIVDPDVGHPGGNDP